MKKSYNRTFHLCSRTQRLLWAGSMVFLLLAGGCKKFLNIPLPANSVAGSDAYGADQTTSGVLNGIYNKLLSSSLAGTGIGYYAGLYTDDLQNVSITNTTTKLWYSNVITGTYGGVYWTYLYNQIGVANTTIEAMRPSSLPNRNQWLGEALFLRALMYYYLVNMYGDVALAVSSDYKVNNVLSRAPKSSVYQQIVADLKEAQGLLGAGYVDYNGNTATDRARPDQAAAAALLARVDLYLGNWADAETLSTAVIGNPAYTLETPANVFLATSKENIWGLLPPSGLGFSVADARNYVFTPGTNIVTSQVNVALSPSLVNSFEPGDLRLTKWTDTTTTGTPTYYYAHKYRVIGPVAKATETLTLLRLAEQYLIRAEARAQQNNLAGAASDLNVIRSRAGLPGTTAATQAGLLTAIAQERRVELFTEQGHRFFDLKRTGKIDAVMGTVSPQKGSAWQTYMQYWPIPTTETLVNPNLTQTPGYQQ
jgi:hypothetical protein